MSEISQWCGSGSKGIEWREKQSHPTKICFEINLGILLTWIWIRIHQILWFWFRIPSILIHIPARGQAVEIHAGEYLRIEMIKKRMGKQYKTSSKCIITGCVQSTIFCRFYIAGGGAPPAHRYFLVGKKLFSFSRFFNESPSTEWTLKNVRWRIKTTFL